MEHPELLSELCNTEAMNDERFERKMDASIDHENNSKIVCHQVRTMHNKDNKDMPQKSAGLTIFHVGTNMFT